MKKKMQDTNLFHTQREKHNTSGLLELTRDERFLEGSSDVFDLLALRDFKKTDKVNV